MKPNSDMAIAWLLVQPTVVILSPGNLQVPISRCLRSLSKTCSKAGEALCKQKVQICHFNKRILIFNTLTCSGSWWHDPILPDSIIYRAFPSKGSSSGCFAFHLHFCTLVEIGSMISIHPSIKFCNLVCKEYNKIQSSAVHMHTQVHLKWSCTRNKTYKWYKFQEFKGCLIILKNRKKKKKRHCHLNNSQHNEPVLVTKPPSNPAALV